jgi:very-short-patch-repair endonuclease
MSAAAIGRAIGRGLLHQEFPGVYRVGHRAPSTPARYAAAVLACGEGAVLGEHAAAHLLALTRGAAPTPHVLARVKRRIPGIVVRRARALDPADVRLREGIPCTTVARTLVDLAGALSLDALTRAHHEAWIRYRLRPETVEEVLDRRRTARGATILRAVVRGDEPVLLSRLEKGFRAFLVEHGFPRPMINRPLGAKYIDCRWAEHRLTVELDSYRFHATRRGWEEDQQRFRDARARGEEFRRFTWRDVFEDRTHMLGELSGLLPRQ